jgi:hypothetical protein
MLGLAIAVRKGYRRPFARLMGPIDLRLAGDRVWSGVRELADSMGRKADDRTLEIVKAGSRISSPGGPETALPARLTAVFAPVHTGALGVAVGLTLGALVALLTTFHVIVRPPRAPDIGLLSQYFPGYAVSPQGIGIGFTWGFVTGLILGWFAGAARNVVLRLTLTLVHRRASLAQPFLDDIS